MKNYFKWIYDNKEWIFSGIGISILCGIVKWIINKINKGNNETNQSNNSSNQVIKGKVLTNNIIVQSKSECGSNKGKQIIDVKKLSDNDIRQEE